jgi:hypothetical protein
MQLKGLSHKGAAISSAIIKAKPVDNKRPLKRTPPGSVSGMGGRPWELNKMRVPHASVFEACRF